MIIAAFNELTVPKELMSSNWEKAFLWLKEERWKTTPEGKMPVDGERVFASRSKYRSKRYENCRYETHRRYADIQFVVQGKELMEVCRADEVTVSEAYNAEKDIDRREGAPNKVDIVVLSYPTAAILFPDDAHKPCIAPDNIEGGIEKILVKVEL